MQNLYFQQLENIVLLGAQSHKAQQLAEVTPRLFFLAFGLFIYLFIFGPIRSMWEFLGQGSNCTTAAT